MGSSGDVKDVEYFRCSCHSLEHAVVVEVASYFGEDVEVTLSVSAFQWQGFFRRFWEGLKYAFVGKRGGLTWDTTILNPEDVDRLISILERSKNRSLYFPGQKAE